MAGNTENKSSAEFFSIDEIFSVESFNRFRYATALTNVQVCNNIMVAATGKNNLIRFPINAPHEVVEIKISQHSDDRVHNLFLDPMGWHTIICMQSGASFYTNRSMKHVRAIHKAKDILIDSVAWNQFNTNESSTQEILIGSNDGIIYETVLLSEEGRIIATSIEQYWRQVITIGSSVTSLEVIRFPPGSMSAVVGEPQRCVVLATTPSRMHQFAGWIHSSGGGSTTGILSNSNSGTALLSQMAYAATGTNMSSPLTEAGSGGSASAAVVGDGGFTGSVISDVLLNQSPRLQAAGITSNSTPSFFQSVFTGDSQLPHGFKVTEFPQNFGYSDLKVYRHPNSELPTQFAWMTGPGVFFGYLKTEQLPLPPHARVSNQTADILLDGSVSTIGDIEQTSEQLRDVFAGRGVNFTRKTKLLSYPVIPMLERPGHPLGISITAFHIVIAYADRVKAINLLDDRTIFSMPISADLGHSPALGICRDPVSGQIWLFGSGGVARLKVKNEACRIWQIYTNRLQFNEARRFCQDKSQIDTVNLREAEHCFDKGDYMRSARLFAETSVSFEEVALRFSQLSLDHQPLNLRSTSPPIPKGLMVTSDEDVINATLEGLGNNGLGTERRAHDQMSNEVFVNSQSTNGSNEGRRDVQQMVDSATPLKVLVATKLDILDKESRNKKMTDTNVGQAGFLSLWLAELLLTEMGFIRDQIASHRQSSMMDATRLEAAEQEFKQLLRKPAVRSMLPHTKYLLYNLIESHGANEEYFFLTDLLRDYTRLCDKYMQLGRHADALTLIDRQGSSNEGCIECMYKYATNLATTHSEDLVNTWLRLGKQLNPVKLLPAVMLLSPGQAMRYLNVAVSRLGCSDQAVHHLLISLCAENSTGVSNCPLMNYLEHASAEAVNLAALGDRTCWLDCDVPAAGQPADSVADIAGQSGLSASLVQDVLPYDPGFALRTCKEVGHLQGTVYILKLLGMHQQALQTAIDADDIRLAKQIAENDSLSSETRRHLWMRLAKHVIEKQNNIQEATTLLRECPLLKLEDILPYFHDFLTVDQFKDSICSSLDSYCDRIDEVKRDMQATMSCATALRDRLTQLTHRYDELQVDSRCLQCGHVLVQRSFYVFPCGHRFHVGCLTDLVRASLVNGQLPALSNSPEEPDALLDHLIENDCVFCGQLAIDGVANLFFPNQTAYEAELAVWK